MLHRCKKCSDIFKTTLLSSLDHCAERIFVGFWKAALLAELQAWTSRSCKFLLFLKHRCLVNLTVLRVEYTVTDNSLLVGNLSKNYKGNRNENTYTSQYKTPPLRNLCLKVTRGGGVQHGVWTRLQSFLIIRESIDITMLKPWWFSKSS